MRYTVPLLLLLLVAACEDALGPAGSCAAEMRMFRITHGEPNSKNEGNDGAEFWETWIYFPQGTDPGRTVTFRWGTDLDRCQVTQAASAIIPARDPSIIR